MRRPLSLRLRGAALQRRTKPLSLKRQNDSIALQARTCALLGALLDSAQPVGAPFRGWTTLADLQAALPWPATAWAVWTGTVVLMKLRFGLSTAGSTARLVAGIWQLHLERVAGALSSEANGLIELVGILAVNAGAQSHTPRTDVLGPLHSSID